MGYAEPQDVRDRWIAPQSIGAFSDATIRRLILEAEDSVNAAFPDMEERVDAGTVPAIRVNRVVVRMVIRALRNPSGMRTQQETVGPFSGSVTFGGDEPGEIYLSAEDRAALAPNVSGVARTIRVGISGVWSV